MFEKYYSLVEKCEQLDNPTYEQLKEIQKEWDSYTLELFKMQTENIKKNNGYSNDYNYNLEYIQTIQKLLQIISIVREDKLESIENYLKTMSLKYSLSNKPRTSKYNNLQLK